MELKKEKTEKKWGRECEEEYEHERCEEVKEVKKF